ncbi:MAG: metalloregulator ArsR/SmtB family transcription factor [Thermoanaerobaculia bacterium]
MRLDDAVGRLSALAHPSRLAVFRLLVQSGPEGLAAGAIAERLEIAPPTLSFHLAQLASAGLVASRRDGRSILYSADFTAAGELVAYLYENCCAGGCEPAVHLPPVRRADRRTEP